MNIVTTSGFRKLLTLTAALALGPLVSVQAIPVLQLYIEGATYDAATESWVATGGSPVRLWTIGNVDGPGGAGTISNVKLAIAYDINDTASITVEGTTTGDFGGFFDPSNPGNPTLLRTVTDGSIPTLTDGSPLPKHGEYGAGTAWQEYALGNFTLEDSPMANFIDEIPTAGTKANGQINAYTISFSGTESLHFDLYDSVQAGNKAKYTFAPFSHDAGGGQNVPDGGATAALLGLGVLGLAAIRRKS